MPSCGGFIDLLGRGQLGKAQVLHSYFAEPLKVSKEYKKCI